MKTKLLAIIIGGCVGLGMVLVLGFYHVKVDLFPHISLVMPESYKEYCDKGFLSDTTCNVYMDDQIYGQNDYLRLFYLLDNATKDTKITFHLSGYGGDAASMITLGNHIRASEAEVTMNVEGPVYSAHANLALCGDKLKVVGTVFLMFHDVQYDPSRGQDAQLVAFLALAHNFMHEIGDGIITPEQFDYMFSDMGAQLYLDGALVQKLFNAKHGIID